MSTPPPSAPSRRRRRTTSDTRRRPPLFALTDAAGALAAALLAGEAGDEQVQVFISETMLATNLDREAAASCLFALAIRDRTLLVAEPTAALQAQLAGLALFASATHASLWLVERDEELCLAQAGGPVANGRLRAAARSTVSRGRVAASSDIRAMPVERQGVPCGALVFRLPRTRVGSGLAYAAETARGTSAILERQALLDRTVSSGEELLEAAERRIARLGFDIHDGPLQELAIVAGELSALSRQLHTTGNGEIAALADTKLTELKALVLDLGGELRTIASTASPGRLYLREMLEREVARLEQLTGIGVDLELTGDLEEMTASQRIAAARVVEEALANVREHSGATRVQVSLRRGVGYLELYISDNGSGFDVTRARRRASRDRCLGLIGMEQRVRLLGGELDVTSRPGGPTVISGSIPAWEPSRAIAATRDREEHASVSARNTNDTRDRGTTGALR